MVESSEGGGHIDPAALQRIMKVAIDVASRATNEGIARFLEQYANEVERAPIIATGTAEWSVPSKRSARSQPT